MTIWRRLNTFRFLLVLLLLAGVGLAFWISHARTEAEQLRAELVSYKDTVKYDLLLMIDSVRGMAATGRSGEPKDVEAAKVERRRYRDADLDFEANLAALNRLYPARAYPRLAGVLKELGDLAGPASTGGILGEVRDLVDRNPENALTFFESKQAELNGRRDPLFRELESQVEQINRARTLQAQTISLAGTVGLVLILVASIVLGHLQSAMVAGPLNRLASTLERMRQGDFSQRLDLDHKDEFGIVSEGLNRLADDMCELVGRVQRSGLRVNTAAAQISATARAHQASAAEIAATTSQMGETSRQISETSRALVKTIQEVNQVAEQAGRLAASGQSAIVQMESTLRQMMEAAGGISAKLAVLSEKTTNINSVVTTITRVADQTNLLSLNAAIEAEKAGEYGLGFAVVASEIRRLADQTAVATCDIEKTVSEIESAVAAGVSGMDKFSEQVRSGVQEVRRVGAHLADIITQVQSLPPRFEAVDDGVQTQTAGAQEISETLVRLSESAHQTAEALRNCNLGIGELNEAARGLAGSILRFKLRPEIGSTESLAGSAGSAPQPPELVTCG